MNITFDKYAYNPLYWHIKKYLADPSIRYIKVFGGSSAAKTYTIAQLLQETSLVEKQNVKVFRKESSTLWDSVYNDFKTISKLINNAYKFFDILSRWIKTSENITMFGGMDDPEKAKGLSGYKYLFFNELSKFEFSDLKEIRRRMRGIIGQTAIFDWNPISETHWIKVDLIDKDTWIDMPNEIEDCPGISKLDDNSFVKINKKGNTILIKTTYKDNFWIVGHPIEGYGMIDQNTLDDFEWSKEFAPYDYQVYALGEYGQVRTGNEFWRAFEINNHVKTIAYDPNTTLHVSIDNNRLPYIAVTIWQVYPDNKLIRQIEEVICSDPDNTATRAGQRVISKLKDYKYEDIVFLYGDASTKSGNTIDEQKRSFYDIFEEQLKKDYTVRDRVPRSNTSVSQKGEFINALYNGWQDWSIEIAEHCRLSISDYIDVKMDKDGAIMKKKFKDKELDATYEKNGHLSDTKKDFISECLNTEFRQWQNKGTDFSQYDMGVTSDNMY